MIPLTALLWDPNIRAMSGGRKYAIALTAQRNLRIKLDTDVSGKWRNHTNKKTAKRHDVFGGIPCRSEGVDEHRHHIEAAPDTK